MGCLIKFMLVIEKHLNNSKKKKKKINFLNRISNNI